MFRSAVLGHHGEEGQVGVAFVDEAVAVALGAIVAVAGFEVFNGVIDEDVIITDLPGIYSMSPYTSEEIVSRNFVLNDKPDAIINIKIKKGMIKK